MFNVLNQTFSTEDLQELKLAYENLSPRYTYLNKTLLEKAASTELISKMEKVLEQTKGLNLIGLLKYLITDHALPRCLCGNQEILKYRPATVEAFNRCHPASCNKGYECSDFVAARQANTVKTNLNRYGETSPRKVEAIKKKARETCIEKYGVDNPFKVEAIKKKARETCIEKYGVDNASKSQDLLLKRSHLQQERYGVSHPMQRLEVRAKVEHTNLERYGVKHAAQNEQIKAETRDYFLEKYGVTSPLRSPEIQQRIRDYNTEKYGVKYSAQSEEFQTKMREGVFRKYGVSCVYKLPEIQQKIKNTLLAKYGVEHPLQHPGFFAKFQKTCKKYKDIEVEGRTLRLQGYEGQALKWLLEERGIPISSIVASLDDKNLLRVSYMKEGKPSVYYPDFLINEADIYEVKSTFTLYANVRIYKELVSKALSCLNQGFSFTLLLVIIENKITRVIEMPSDWYTLEYVDSLQYLLTTRSISFKISPKLLDFKP